MSKRISASPLLRISPRERFRRATLFTVGLGLLAAAALPADPPKTPRAMLVTPLAELNDGACKPGQQYVQEDLREPVKIGPDQGTIDTELVVRIRARCVPVWISTATKPHWEMQTLKLRTYGFPREPGITITDADADDPNSPKIAWSAPGPTFVMHPASQAGGSDGTQFKMRLYNRMPFDGNPTACVATVKCNTSGPNSGVDPVTGACIVPPDGADGGFPPRVPHQVVGDRTIEPPNCFHGENSTNFHFHGFHVSPHLGQDDVGLELRPPLPVGLAEDAMPAYGPHGKHGNVAYGQFDFDVDPLRYTQAPGTHWYHAHKHGSTALQVLNGLVGTFEITGQFDQELDAYFEKQGSHLVDRLMVVQQLQEKQPGLGGTDQNGSVLVNGQANPIVRMAKGEVQRWRFVGATMQASAALRIGFPDVPGRKGPVVRQIAMDGVQFSPQNYSCQPFLNNPDCSPAVNDSGFDELTAFQLSPGNRIDVLIKAPDEPGVHCLLHDITTRLDKAADAKIRGALREQAAAAAGTCGVDPATGLGPLFTLIVEDRDQPMTFPDQAHFPALPKFLDNIPKASRPEQQKNIYYEMVNQGNLDLTQFWISQQKYDPNCANENLVVDVPEQWTLWNNSGAISHPFHIHQNPFQLLSQSDRGTYKYPVWRDTLAIPKATTPSGLAFLAPNSNPLDSTYPWGHATLLYVAKEFTGGFVNHCHILGHEDRGMMHNTQATCANGMIAATSPVAPNSTCDAQGFCPGDCQTGAPEKPMEPCAEPPPQQSDWPKAYGFP